MPTPPDPTRPLRRRLAGVWLIGVPACVGCAVWAIGPVPKPEPLTTGPALERAAPAPVDRGPGPLDTKPFTVALWNPPADPEPQPPTTAAPPPPPFAAELVAIVRESTGDRRAAIYDQELGQVVIAGPGEHVGRYSVLAIDDDGVELTDGRTSRRLRLDDESS